MPKNSHEILIDKSIKPMTAKIGCDITLLISSELLNIIIPQQIEERITDNAPVLTPTMAFILARVLFFNFNVPFLLCLAWFNIARKAHVVAYFIR